MKCNFNNLKAKKVDYVSEHRQKVFQIEAAAIRSLCGRLDAGLTGRSTSSHAAEAVSSLQNGKTGIIAQKISATVSSLGIPSLFLNPAEAIHGDLGALRQQTSSSPFPTPERPRKSSPCSLSLKNRRELITIRKHPLHYRRYSDIVLDVSVKKRLLARRGATSSTTAALAMVMPGPWLL